jgi:hypothetical protein
MPAAARVRGRERSEFIKPKPRNDVYTILLTISLISLLVGCLLLYWDYNAYTSKKAPDVPKPVLSAAPAPAAPAPAAAPATPPPAGGQPGK